MGDIVYIDVVIGSAGGRDGVVEEGVGGVSEVELKAVSGIGDTDDPVAEFKESRDKRSS